MGGDSERSPSIEIQVWEGKTYEVVSFPPQAGWGKLLGYLAASLA
jgi:hypothetical protein